MQNISTCDNDIETNAEKVIREIEQRDFSRFLEKIRQKEAKVAVIGLGYVGLPLSISFAEAGLEVFGLDVDEKKVRSISKRESYLETLPTERLAEVVLNEKFSASTEFESVATCDAVIICVPTPLTHHLEPDLSYIESTCKAIAPFLKPHTLVCLESTTWPGTTEEVVAPLLEKHGLLKRGIDLYLAFSPEREDPGNKDYSTKTIPKLVGAIDDKSAQLASELYSHAIEEVIMLSSPAVAEASKLLENIFRSVNIALVNELKVIFDRMGINVWEVIQGAATKPFGYMPFWPGPGLGGHCIPIDPFYLTWKAKEYGINTRFIELAGEINRNMPLWVVAKVQDCLNDYGKAVKNSRVLVMGLSYKPDVSDLRESPSLHLITQLKNKGAIVDYHDPHFPELPSTREFKQLEGMKTQDLSADYDCIILATGHSAFCSKRILSLGVPVVDTRNFLPKHELVYQA